MEAFVSDCLLGGQRYFVGTLISLMNIKWGRRLVVDPGNKGSEHLQQYTRTVSLAYVKLLRLKASQVKTSSWLTKIKDLIPVLFVVRILSLQQVIAELRFKMSH